MIKNLKIYFLLLSWMILGISQIGVAQVSGFDFYRISATGGDRINIGQIEFARLTLAYQEKKMNNWYEKFWKKEGFKSPDFCYVRVTETPLHPDALLLVFEVADTLAQIDTAYAIHHRIAQMLIDDLKPKIDMDSTQWIQWMAAISPNYMFKNGRKSNKQLMNSSELEYLIPDSGKVELLAPPTMKGTKMMRITTIEYAIEFLKPSIEDLHLLYKQFLDFNGLILHLNAEIKIEKNRFNEDAVNFVFKLDSLAESNDPNLTQHKALAKQMHAFITRKAEPIQTKWLRFRFEAQLLDKKVGNTLLFE